MDKTNAVSFHIPTQEQIIQKQPVSDVAPTELTSSQSSLPTDEQSAATYKMFTQGAASGGVTSKKRTLEETSQDIQPKTKKANTDQTVDSTKSTSPEIVSTIAILHEKLISDTITASQNSNKIFQLTKTSSKEEIDSFVDKVQKFIDTVTERVKNVKLNPSEKFLLSHLIEVVEKPCIEVWQTPHSINLDLRSLEYLYLNLIVMSSLVEQLPVLMIKHNEINSKYLETIYQQTLAKNIISLRKLLVQLTTDEIEILKNSLILSIQNPEEAPQKTEGLSEKYIEIFCMINKLFDCLIDFDRTTTLSSVLNEVTEAQQNKQQILETVNEHVSKINHLSNDDKKAIKHSLINFYPGPDLTDDGTEVLEDLREFYLTISFEDKEQANSIVLKNIEASFGW